MARKDGGTMPREARDNVLVLTSVTAMLRNLLENGLVERGVTANIGSDTTVSALPPDRITTGTEEKAQLNLFLYQIKSKGLEYPSRYAIARSPGSTTEPPRPPASSLAFDLYYLVTAYGAQDFHFELLLGYALEMLHENPVIPGDAVRSIFSALASTQGGRVVLPAFTALADSALAARIEQIKIAPHVLNMDETFNLWSTLQATYRPSAAYKVSVYLSPPAAGQ